MKIINYLIPIVMIFLSFGGHTKDEPKEIVLAANSDKLLNKISHAVGSKVFGKFSIQFRLKQFPKERALAQANSGVVDGDAYRVFDFHKVTNNEYPNLMRINETYLSVSFTAFVTDKNKDLEVADWTDLSKYKVAVIRGNKKMEARAKKYLQKENRIVVSEYEQAFGKLTLGRLDVVIGKPSVGIKVMRKKKNIHMRGKFGVRELFFYIHKKHSSLIPKIEAEIKKLREDGTLKEIEKQAREEIFR